MAMGIKMMDFQIRIVKVQLSERHMILGMLLDMKKECMISLKKNMQGGNY